MGEDRWNSNHTIKRNLISTFINQRGNIINAKKHKVINEIISKNQTPEVVVFKKGISEKEAFHIENLLIKRFKDKITNSQSGILSYEEKSKEWAKSVQRKIIPYEIWLALKPRTDLEKECYNVCVSKVNELTQQSIKCL